MKIDGKELKITLASFDEAMELHDALIQAAKGNNIDLPESLDSDVDVGSFLDAIASLVSSTEVREKLFACAKRCVLGEGEKTEKINREFFDDPKHWKHYYPIMFEIAKANLSPFFENLGSMFTDLQKITENFPQQKSKQSGKSS